MGRPSTSSGRLSIELDPALKMRASIAALKAGVSLSQLVERGLKLAIAELREGSDRTERQRRSRGAGEHRQPAVPGPEQPELPQGER